MTAVSLPLYHRSARRGFRLPVVLLLPAMLAGFAPRAVSAQAPEPGSADRQAYAQLFLPTMPLDVAGCRPVLAVQNLGQEPSKAVLVTWAAPGSCAPQAAGPLKVECSGLLAPGTAWSFSARQLPSGSRSGAVFSFSARLLSELGVHLPKDDVAADWMCENLFFGVVGDADDYARFLQAFRDGSEAYSVPLGRIVGAPIGALWKEDCDGSQPNYHALRPALASRFSFEDGSYLSYLPWVEPGWTLWAQNLGTDCAQAELRFAVAAGSSRTCETAGIAPGESWRLELRDCIDEGAGAWVRSTGPIAVVARLASRAAYTGQGAGGTELHLALPQLATDSRIMVQNPSTQLTATVTLRLRSGKGDVLLAEEAVVPPRQTTVLRVGRDPLGASAEAPLSLLLQATGGADMPPLPVIAVVMSQSEGDHRMTGGSWSMMASEPAQSGAALFGLPSIGRDLPSATGAARASRILLHNSAEVPGFTDIAVYLHDQNGFLDVSCQRLNQRQVTVTDLQTLGFLSTGFRGSALVSAAFWEHDVFAPDGTHLRNVVSLLAAVQEPMPMFSDPGFHQGLAAGKREAGFAASAALPACPPAGGPTPGSRPPTLTPPVRPTPSPSPGPGTPSPGKEGRSAYLPAVQLDR